MRSDEKNSRASFLSFTDSFRIFSFWDLEVDINHYYNYELRFESLCLCLSNFCCVIIQMSQDLKSISTSLFANIDKDLQNVSFLSLIEKKTGLHPSQLFLLTTGVVLLLAVFDIMGHLITTLFGMLYPSFMSYKVLSLPLSRSNVTMKIRKKYG